VPAGIDLEQHAGPGKPVTPPMDARRAALARADHPGRFEDPVDRGARPGDVLLLGQHLRQML